MWSVLKELVLDWIWAADRGKRKEETWGHIAVCAKNPPQSVVGQTLRGREHFNTQAICTSSLCLTKKRHARVIFLKVENSCIPEMFREKDLNLTRKGKHCQTYLETQQKYGGDLLNLLPWFRKNPNSNLGDLICFGKSSVMKKVLVACAFYHLQRVHWLESVPNQVENL